MEKEVFKAYGISAYVSKLEQARTIEEVAKIVAEEKPRAERHFYKLFDALVVIERRASYGYCQFNPEWRTCEARRNSNPPSTRSGVLGAIIEEERVKFQQLSKSPEEI